MGRVKLEIRKIENPTNRQVTYSKRRNGLIKKAYELSVLCEIDIALLMFSPSGRLNHFAGKKRIEDVIARFATLSDHERSKSQCLKWCISDDQQGPNAPRKIENPELLLKAAKKLKQESYITTTTIGGQFSSSSSRSTSLETVQYEIQRTQAQLHEMENRLRIYEGDVKCVDSIQQLENLEQHLHNALETLRLHKQAMESSSCQAAVPRPFIDASGSSSQLMYGMQLQQQEVAGNSISSNCSSMLQNASNANNATNCSSNPQQNIIHHWLSAYSQNAVAAADHHANVMATPIADHPPMGTIINPSMRESPGECSSATSTLYNRGLCSTPTPPTTANTTTTTPPDHHHRHHHHAVLQNPNPNPNSNSSPLSDQAATTTSQTLSHNLAFSAARSQWTASSSVSPYHPHHLHHYSNENNETTANYGSDSMQDSKSMICSSLKDMDPIKLSCQNYGNNQEGNIQNGQGIQGMMGGQAEMHHMDMADRGGGGTGNLSNQQEVLFHSQNPEADHQYQQQWGGNPLSLSQAQAVMGMMLARNRQQAPQEDDDDDDQQPELINIMSFNHQMNPNHINSHDHQLLMNQVPHLYPNPNHQIGMQHIFHHHHHQNHQNQNHQNNNHHQQESARTEASVLSTCTMHELPAGNIMNQMSHQQLIPRHVHGDDDADDGDDDDDDGDGDGDHDHDEDEEEDDDDMNIIPRDHPHHHADHREDIHGHDLSLGSGNHLMNGSSSAPIRYS